MGLCWVQVRDFGHFGLSAGLEMVFSFFSGWKKGIGCLRVLFLECFIAMDVSPLFLSASHMYTYRCILILLTSILPSMLRNWFLLVSADLSDLSSFTSNWWSFSTESL